MRDTKLLYRFCCREPTFKIILLTYPKVMEHSIPSKKEEGQRSPLTGTIDEIGTDVKR
jgi:hypothetical protein